MKTISLIGGNGEVGRILYRGLSDIYNIYILDKNIDENVSNNIKVDATNYEDLLKKVPDETDVIINLLSIPVSDGLVDINKASEMIDLFLKSSYNIFNVATELKVGKVIYSSSNHVTDYYEKDGYSCLGREINVTDYPYSKGLYGVLKLASENIGFAFHKEKDLSVINLRIGTVRNNEKEILKINSRYKRTLLSKVDTINLYKCAIESRVQFGTFYGVSNNIDKPWNIENTCDELNFKPLITSDDLLDEKYDL